MDWVSRLQHLVHTVQGAMANMRSVPSDVMHLSKACKARSGTDAQQCSHPVAMGPPDLKLYAFPHMVRNHHVRCTEQEWRICKVLRCV